MCAAAISATFALGEHTSHADPPRFRVTWLTDPNAPNSLDTTGLFPDSTVHGTMGINNKGQVVYGYSPSYQAPVRACAVLLTPYPDCPWDIDEDGCVTNYDVQAVINKWGNCPPGQICIWDMDVDGIVNLADSVAVYNQYNICRTSACEGCCSECCSNFSSTEPLTLEDLILMVYESPHSAEVQAEIIQALVGHFGS